MKKRSLVPFFLLFYCCYAFFATVLRKNKLLWHYNLLKLICGSKFLLKFIFLRVLIGINSVFGDEGRKKKKTKQKNSSNYKRL